jgi:hypothetical protein
VKIRIGDLKKIMLEARRGRMDTYLQVLEEAPSESGGDSKAHSEGASGDSLDNQIDRYLAQYESDSKKTDDDPGVAGPGSAQMERIDWRDLVKGFIVEAGQADKDDAESPDTDAPGADSLTGEDTDKLGLDSLDVAKFADNVVRLIENYDSLLEVKSTLMRRAKNFLVKNYSDEVVGAYEDVLRDDHGMEVGKDKMAIDAEQFPAPPAARAAGSAEPGPGGGGAP